MMIIQWWLLAVSIIFSACEKEEEEDIDTLNPTNPSGLTYIPDDNFESFLENLGIGNGVSNDNFKDTI